MSSKSDATSKVDQGQESLKTYGLMALAKDVPMRAEVEPEDMEFVWPHLVYREFICALFVVVVLWFLSLLVGAPLEEAANSSVTPNPAKAPWYFSALQEMLVYFDPWLAGVVIPSIILVGLIALPYIDNNPRGSGEYAFRLRPLAVRFFTFGLILWFALLIIGQIFRGPNWEWYWPWESWSVYKLTTSQARDLPNFVGIPLVLGYFAAGFFLPFKRWPEATARLGGARTLLVAFFILGTGGVVIKILLRILFNIKYIVHTPWLNI